MYAIETMFQCEKLNLPLILPFLPPSLSLSLSLSLPSLSPPLNVNEILLIVPQMLTFGLVYDIV